MQLRYLLLDFIADCTSWFRSTRKFELHYTIDPIVCSIVCWPLLNLICLAAATEANTNTELCTQLHGSGKLASPKQSIN